MRKSEVSRRGRDNNQSDTLHLLLNSSGINLDDFMKYDSQLSVQNAMSGD